MQTQINTTVERARIIAHSASQGGCAHQRLQPPPIVMVFLPENPHQVVSPVPETWALETMGSFSAPALKCQHILRTTSASNESSQNVVLPILTLTSTGFTFSGDRLSLAMTPSF